MLRRPFQVQRKRRRLDLRGEPIIDTRSDVCSLGVVLYELLAPRPPFEGKTAIDVLASLNLAIQDRVKIA